MERSVTRVPLGTCGSSRVLIGNTLLDLVVPAFRLRDDPTECSFCAKTLNIGKATGTQAQTIPRLISTTLPYSVRNEKSQGRLARTIEHKLALKPNGNHSDPLPTRPCDR
jgi:hypothetical protein